MLSLNLIAQKSPKDIVDFKNFDYVFVENLLYEKFNSEIVKISKQYYPLKKDSIAYKAIEYQLSHFKNGGEVVHDNKKPFRGILLVEPSDRIEYFGKKKLIGGLIVEVCQTFEKFYHIRDTSKKTYYVENFDEYKNFQMVKTEKFNDGRKYYTYDNSTKTYTNIDDSNFLYNDHITYEYIVDEIYTNFMVNSKFHRAGILMSAERNSFCYWKIEMEYTKNSFRIWSGSVFYQ